MTVYFYDTPAGKMKAVIRSGMIQELNFLQQAGKRKKTESFSANGRIQDNESENIKIAEHLKKELDAYFAGNLKKFTVPLNPEGSEFQKKVWEGLLTIPWGTTISYKEQSILMGRPDAVRAVAGANGRNPIAILIPCHRVISSDGNPGGYSGGLHLKMLLLQTEGVLLKV